MNSLENDPWLRTRFQYWFFYYDTGNPAKYSADVLRTSLQYVVEQLDSDGTDAALRQMVIIGHSQGGLLTKMTAIDSGAELWNTVSSRPLDELVLREPTREEFRRTLFLKPLPFVRRVIFIATPHRGATLPGVGPPSGSPASRVSPKDSWIASANWSRATLGRSLCPWGDCRAVSIT